MLALLAFLIVVLFVGTAVAVLSGVGDGVLRIPGASQPTATAIPPVATGANQELSDDDRFYLLKVEPGLVREHDDAQAFSEHVGLLLSGASQAQERNYAPIDVEIQTLLRDSTSLATLGSSPPSDMAALGQGLYALGMDDGTCAGAANAVGGAAFVRGSYIANALTAALAARATQAANLDAYIKMLDPRYPRFGP